MYVRLFFVHQAMDTVQIPYKPHEISGFRREVDTNCVLLGYYAASSNLLPTFRGNLSVTSSRANNQRRIQTSWILPLFLDSYWTCWPLNMYPIGCTETSARNYHYWPRKACCCQKSLELSWKTDIDAQQVMSGYVRLDQVRYSRAPVFTDPRFTGAQKNFKIKKINGS
jgi:hypothetical protein